MNRSITVNRESAELVYDQADEATSLIGGAGVIAALRHLPAASLQTVLATIRQSGAAPRLRPTPIMMAAHALEDAATTAMLRSASAAVSPEAARAIVADADRAVQVLERGGYVDAPETLFPAPPAPTQVRRTRRTWRGLNFGHTSFPSAYRTVEGLPRSEQYLADQANSIVHMYVLRHDDNPRPYLVMLHPYQTGEVRDLLLFGSLLYFFGLGVNVVHPVLPLHGPRGIKGSRRYPTVDAVTNLLACTQAISDVRSILHLLRQRNATAIGVHGYSLGGFTAALLAGIEPDLDCVIAGAAPVELIPGRPPENDGTHHARVGTMLAEGSPAELRRLVSPLSHRPKLPRERRFIYACAGDQMVASAAPGELRAHWDGCRFAWLQATHLTGLTAPAARRFVWRALRATGISAATQPPDDHRFGMTEDG
jgi:hypothetical protein